MIHFLRRIFRLLRGRSAAGQGLYLLAMVALIVGYGSVGFHHFEAPVQEGLQPGDAVWWSVVTMTTVGYGDFFPRTWEGRWLVSLPVMVLGIGVLGYAIGVLTTAVLERHQKEMKGMLPYTKQGQVFLCHYPSEETVLEVIEEIRADDQWKGRDIVLVTDRLHELTDALRQAQVHFVSGHPSREASLQQAGIAGAHRVLILSQDPGNPDTDNHSLGVLVTVRALNPTVQVVAECVAKENVKLLVNAGASEVVGLGSLTAGLLVQGMQDPGVNGLIAELVTNRTGHQFYIEPIATFRGTWGGLEQELQRRGRYALLGLIGAGGRTFLPDPATPVEPGQRVMLIGARRPAAI